MREEFNLLIKPCATWTVPAAETKTIGLQAYASANRRNTNSIKPPGRYGNSDII